MTKHRGPEGQRNARSERQCTEPEGQRSGEQAARRAAGLPLLPDIDLVGTAELHRLRTGLRSGMAIFVGAFLTSG